MVISTTARTLISAALACACGVAWAADAYNVSMRLWEGDRELDQPVLTVHDGVPAIVEVSGDAGYRLALTASDAGSEGIRIVANLKTASGAFAPELVVRPAQEATVSAGDFRIALTATSQPAR